MAEGSGPGRRSSGELIDLVADGGSLRPWDRDVVSDDPLEFCGGDYARRLERARRETGVGEAVVTGRARVAGRDVALVAGEFGFLGGSIGAATGERITRAFERAADLSLPLVAMTSSGGTRMQEGTLAFAQMVKTAAAVRRFRDTGQCYLVWLGHPTMGGVLASWGSLAHVSFAAPGATIGFTGPRVVELTTGHGLDPDVQTAESLAANGLVDAVVAPARLRERVDRVLSVVCPPTPAGRREPAGRDPGHEPTPPVTGPADVWAAVRCSRDARRPGLRRVLDERATHLTFLRGDGCGGDDDPGCVAALCRLDGVPAVVVGHDRHVGGRGALVGAGGYRKARRAMGLAEELRLPLVTFVDTPGAQVSRQAEQQGLSAEIARCLAAMIRLATPTLAVLLGEGSGGGALAWLAADRVVCAERAWLAPIAPEGGSAILHRTTERAAELAAAQAVASTDLRRLGLVDIVVAERDCAAREPDAFVLRLADAVHSELTALLEVDDDARLAARATRWRDVGTPRQRSPHGRAGT